jgi:hypothetical protein
MSAVTPKERPKTAGRSDYQMVQFLSAGGTATGLFIEVGTAFSAGGEVKAGMLQFFN